MNKGEVFLTGLTAFVVWASFAMSHEVDERYDPGPDSMKVQLEIDATDDGVWEVRHVFFDTLGAWDRSTSGSMRVTTTYDDSTHTTYGDFNQMALDGNDTLMVLLSEFSSFGQAYADTLLLTPTGVKMFESPNYEFYMVPKED